MWAPCGVVRTRSSLYSPAAAISSSTDRYTLAAFSNMALRLLRATAGDFPLFWKLVHHPNLSKRTARAARTARILELGLDVLGRGVSFVPVVWLVDDWHSGISILSAKASPTRHASRTHHPPRN